MCLRWVYKFLSDWPQGTCLPKESPEFRSWTLQSLCATPAVDPVLKEEDQKEDLPPCQTSSQQDTPLMLKVEDDKTDISSMRPGHVPTKKNVRSVGTQLSRNTLVSQRSKGSQYNYGQTTLSKGTQTVITVSVAIGTPVQDADPGEHVSTESILSQASPSTNDVPKYIVDEDCLLELFEDCVSCGSACEVQKTIRGTFLAIHQMCPKCKCSRNWKSQRLEAVSSDDPGTSVAAITEIIGCSDENDSDEGSSVSVIDCNSDSDWDPDHHHDEDDILSDSEPDEDAGSESDADKKREMICRKLCPECGAFFYSQTHTCENKKPYPCNVCGKRFVSERPLKIHKRSHEVGYKHVCKYCFSSFGMRSDMLIHEQSHPPRQKPYQCPDCPKVFAKIRERRKHLRSHRGPKKHICHICSMDFPSVSGLERHMPVHTQAKQFVCEVCQRSFIQSSHLKSHMRVHTGEKPYQCQHCEKSFNHNVSLKSHIQRYHDQDPDPGPGETVQVEEASRNDFEMERDEMDKVESSGVDSEEAEQRKDTLCNAGEEGAELEKGKEVRKRKYHESSGRPKGRPKRNAMVTSRSVSEVEKDDSNQMAISATDIEEAKTDEMESNGINTDEAEKSNTLCNPDDEQWVQKKERYRYKPTGRPRGRPKKNTLLTLDLLCVGEENDKENST